MTTELLNLREFSHDSPITIESSEQPIQMTVHDVLRWIAPQAPPGEALKFLLTCRTARLNPFLNEAYLVQMKDRWGTIIAKAGYLKRAQQNPDYDGHESGIVVQAFDTATKQKHGPLIEQVGEIVPGGFLLLGGWAKVWKRGLSRPIHGQVSFSEYDKGTATWKSIPCTMIRKVALVAAIREAFAIGDSYDESEYEPTTKVRVARPDGRDSAAQQVAGMATGQTPAPAGIPHLEAMYARSEDPHLPPAMCERILGLAARVGMPQARLDKILAARGVMTVPDLSPADATFLVSKLEEIASRAPFVESFPDVPKQGPIAALIGQKALDEEAGPAVNHADEGAYEIPEVVRQSGREVAAVAGPVA